MSSSVCFARGTRDHRLPCGLLLFAESSSRNSPLTKRNLFLSCTLALLFPLTLVPQSLVSQPLSTIAAQNVSASAPSAPVHAPLIVIGFLGGHVRAGNLIHREAQLARDLDRRYPNAVRAKTFANHDEASALHFLLNLLDTNQDGRLSDNEKTAARIVLFGHSWGASEVVNLAQELDRRSIPVLLTIQVDSVQKPGEHDGSIPPNVREAINFYQTEGVLHGRSSIQAIDPRRTKILGSYESTYAKTPVSCDGFPWFARTFMKQHIEIENDIAVWNQIDALIVARSCAANPAGMGHACNAMGPASN
jgi:pimeloyl-ACP methyl ester carboxylesterase